MVLFFNYGIIKGVDQTVEDMRCLKKFIYSHEPQGRSQLSTQKEAKIGKWLMTTAYRLSHSLAVANERSLMGNIRGRGERTNKTTVL